MNGRQAAIRAGYSEKTANEQASRLLTKVNIKKFIKTLQAKTDTKLDVSRERVLNELAKIAFFDIRKIYTENDALKAVKDFDDESAAVVAGIETDDILEGRGDDKRSVGTTKKVKLHNKIAALERISKMMGYDAPQEHDVKGQIIWKEEKTYTK